MLVKLVLTCFIFLQKCYHFLFQRYRLEHYTVSSNWLALGTVVVFTVLSLSRSVALFRGVCVRTHTGHFSPWFVHPLKTNTFSASVGYHAPLDLYPEFHRIAKDPTLHSVPEGRPVSVCVGKEWYRFPSSFLLPHKCVSRVSSDSNFHSFPANCWISPSPAGSCTSFSRSLKGSCRSHMPPVLWPHRSSQPT